MKKLLTLLFVFLILTGCTSKSDGNSSVKVDDDSPVCYLEQEGIKFFFPGFYLNGTYYHQGINALVDADRLLEEVLTIDHDDEMFESSAYERCPEKKDGLFYGDILPHAIIFSMVNSEDLVSCIDGYCQVFIKYDKNNIFKTISPDVVLKNMNGIHFNIDGRCPQVTTIKEVTKDTYFRPTADDYYVFVRDKDTAYWYYYRYYFVEDGWFTIMDDYAQKGWKVTYE